MSLVRRDLRLVAAVPDRVKLYVLQPVPRRTYLMMRT